MPVAHIDERRLVTAPYDGKTAEYLDTVGKIHTPVADLFERDRDRGTAHRRIYRERHL